MSLEGAIAAHRFGLGARPGEIVAASTDPRGWLAAQINGPAEQPAGTFKTTGQLVADDRAFARNRVQQRAQAANGQNANQQAAQNRIQPPAAAQGAQADAAVAAFLQPRAQAFRDEMMARFQLGFTTARPFAERLVWFWSNHFTVSVTQARTLAFAGAFEREAIRPYIADSFENMLLAAASHPAMLVYLNNEQSIGPNSLVGRGGKRGLNENLGRELMELYSLGVDGGYTQADVIAMAKLLTGWSLDPDSPTGFNFFPARHEPGPELLRGKTYTDELARPITLRNAREFTASPKAGVAAIRDLAHDPHTARYIAGKFATYFIADNPTPDSVARLEKSFRDTGGNLKALALTAVDDPAAWAPGPGKMRTPVDYVTAAFRTLSLPSGDGDRPRHGRISHERAITQGLAAHLRCLVRAGRHPQPHRMGQAGGRPPAAQFQRHGGGDGRAGAAAGARHPQRHDGGRDTGRCRGAAAVQP
jgi:uncharacterized protein (DUF1800 family)